MFELDHFLDENNWTLDYWKKSVYISYRFVYEDQLTRIYLTTSDEFYSPFFSNESFKDKFIKMTKDPEFISFNGESEFTFNKNNSPKEILKQKLNQIKERNSIFTKEDFNEIFK